MNAPRQTFADLPASQRAGILCRDPRFAAFIASTGSRLTDPADFVRDWCNVESRRDLNHLPDARARLDQLQTAFDAFTGRLPTQR